MNALLLYRLKHWWLTLIFLPVMVAVAQPPVGFLELRGRTVFEGEAIPKVNISLLNGDEVVEQTTSDAKGRYMLNVFYGPDYRIKFEADDYHTAYLEVATSEVPEGSTFIAALSRVEPLLIPKSMTSFPAYLLNDPFARIEYTGKRTFDNDLDYSDAFQQRIATASRAGQRRSMEGMVLAGRIIHLDKTKGGMPFKVVHLKSIDGEILQTFVTNEEGAFVFNKLPGDNAFLIGLEEEDIALDNGATLAVTDQHGKVVQTVAHQTGQDPTFDFSAPVASGSSRLLTSEKDYRISFNGQQLTAKEAHAKSPGTNFRLVDQEGKVLTTTGDTNILMSFIKLLASNDYFLRIDNQNSQIINNTTLVVQDAKGNVIREIRLDELESFDYSLLPSDKIKLVIVKAEEGEMIIAGNIVFGEDPSEPFAFKKIHLIDNNGNVLETAVTNQFGAFIFTRLKKDQPFILRVAEDDAHSEPIEKFTLTNSDNDEIVAVFGDQNGYFEFLFSSEDLPKVETLKVKPELLRSQLKGYLKWNDGGNVPLANVGITLRGNNGLVRTFKTGADGQFSVSNLPHDQAFSLLTDPLDGMPAGGPSVSLYNERLEPLALSDVNSNRQAEFSLAPSQITLLGVIYVEDPWIDLLDGNMADGKDEVVIAENIYFAVNDWQLQPSFRNLLNKVLEVMTANPNLTLELSSHTDSRGSDSYNLDLSEKRASTARAYLISRGIGESRIVSKGYGETRLLNDCGNNRECSEEEHAINRRVEFKVVFN